MKKFTLLAMTAVVAFGMILTGCGASDSSKTTKDSSSNSATTTPSSTTTPAASTGDEQVIHVSAKNYEWVLDKTEVKANKPVKLVITATEGMHGLTIDGTDVKNVHAMSGKEETATFTPTKAGDLQLVCSIMCGTGHGTMKTTLKVTE
jgi:cytochrome c oxidase subunit 2